MSSITGTWILIFLVLLVFFSICIPAVFFSRKNKNNKKGDLQSSQERLARTVDSLCECVVRKDNDPCDELKVRKIFANFKAMLLEKNKRYGDSALNPLKIFNKEGSSNQIKARLDDKLNRIKNGPRKPRKNDLADLIGYLILECVDEGYEDFSDLLD